jgi:hypothetical protein
VNLVKYSNKRIHNGKPEYWFTHFAEQSFILSYAKNAAKTQGTT